MRAETGPIELVEARSIVLGDDLEVRCLGRITTTEPVVLSTTYRRERLDKTAVCETRFTRDLYMTSADSEMCHLTVLCWAGWVKDGQETDLWLNFREHCQRRLDWGQRPAGANKVQCSAIYSHLWSKPCIYFYLGWVKGAGHKKCPGDCWDCKEVRAAVSDGLDGNKVASSAYRVMLEPAAAWAVLFTWDLINMDLIWTGRRSHRPEEYLLNRARLSSKTPAFVGSRGLPLSVWSRKADQNEDHQLRSS